MSRTWSTNIIIIIIIFIVIIILNIAIVVVVVVAIIASSFSISNVSSREQCLIAVVVMIIAIIPIIATTAGSVFLEVSVPSGRRKPSSHELESVTVIVVIRVIIVVMVIVVIIVIVVVIALSKDFGLCLPGGRSRSSLHTCSSRTSWDWGCLVLKRRRGRANGVRNRVEHPTCHVMLASGCAVSLQLKILLSGISAPLWCSRTWMSKDCSSAHPEILSLVRPVKSPVLSGARGGGNCVHEQCAHPLETGAKLGLLWRDPTYMWRRISVL